MDLIIKSLHIYPLKGARGIDINNAKLRPRGIKHDRRFMLINAQGRFLSQRQYPKMAQISTKLHQDGLGINIPGEKEIIIPFPATGRHINVSLWRDEFAACLVEHKINACISAFLGENVNLVFMADNTKRMVDKNWVKEDYPVSFADGYPVLVTNQASLDDLNRHLTEQNERALPMDRFRPNIVIEGANPWEENNWKILRIGEVEIKCVKPCVRCVVTSINQKTGIAGKKSALNALKKLNPSKNPKNQGVVFGQNAIITRLGKIKIGDKVEKNLIKYRFFKK